MAFLCLRSTFLCAEAKLHQTVWCYKNKNNRSMSREAGGTLNEFTSLLSFVFSPGKLKTCLLKSPHSWLFFPNHLWRLDFLFGVCFTYETSFTPRHCDCHCCRNLECVHNRSCESHDTNAYFMNNKLPPHYTHTNILCPHWCRWCWLRALRRVKGLECCWLSSYRTHTCAHIHTYIWTKQHHLKAHNPYLPSSDWTFLPPLHDVEEKTITRSVWSREIQETQLLPVCLCVCVSVALLCQKHIA